jgi:hypothetical protein
MLARQLTQLGCRVEIRQARDVSEFYQATSYGSYDLLLSGWIPDTSDPLEMMETLFCFDSIPAPWRPRGAPTSRAGATLAFEDRSSLRKTKKFWAAIEKKATLVLF